MGRRRAPCPGAPAGRADSNDARGLPGGAPEARPRASSTRVRGGPLPRAFPPKPGLAAPDADCRVLPRRAPRDGLPGRSLRFRSAAGRRAFDRRSAASSPCPTPLTPAVHGSSRRSRGEFPSGWFQRQRDPDPSGADPAGSPGVDRPDAQPEPRPGRLLRLVWFVSRDRVRAIAPNAAASCYTQAINEGIAPSLDREQGWPKQRWRTRRKLLS